jgi:carbon storage regulator
VLVLSRRINETIVIGENIRITLTSIQGRQVRIAIDAPKEVVVLREELTPQHRTGPEQVFPPHRPRRRDLGRGHRPVDRPPQA